jgi:AcrR family transcriptional regulator
MVTATRSDGRRTRDAILDAAARLATVEGIDGLSISGLAEAVGMSKSGLYAHFRSKEELQLATVETASARFGELIVDPAREADRPLDRLKLLTEGFLDHVEAGVFPGGCFFASVGAELDTRPGPVRDLVIGLSDRWLELLADTVRDAQSAGEIAKAEDPEQLAFDLDAYLVLANARFVAHPGPKPMRRARQAIAARLEAAAA